MYRDGRLVRTDARLSKPRSSPRSKQSLAGVESLKFSKSLVPCTVYPVRAAVKSLNADLGSHLDMRLAAEAAL